MNDPFEELQHTVRRLIWLSIAFAIVVSIIAISGLSVAWYTLRSQVERNEQQTIALCQDLNQHNKDIRTILLDFGIPPYELTPFIQRPCTAKSLREDFRR